MSNTYTLSGEAQKHIALFNQEFASLLNIPVTSVEFSRTSPSGTKSSVKKPTSSDSTVQTRILLLLEKIHTDRVIPVNIFVKQCLLYASKLSEQEEYVAANTCYASVLEHTLSPLVSSDALDSWPLIDAFISALHENPSLALNHTTITCVINMMICAYRSILKQEGPSRARVPSRSTSPRGETPRVPTHSNTATSITSSITSSNTSTTALTSSALLHQTLSFSFCPSSSSSTSTTTSISTSVPTALTASSVPVRALSKASAALLRRVTVALAHIGQSMVLVYLTSLANEARLKEQQTYGRALVPAQPTVIPELSDSILAITSVTPGAHADPSQWALPSHAREAHLTLIYTCMAHVYILGDTLLAAGALTPCDVLACAAPLYNTYTPTTSTVDTLTPQPVPTLPGALLNTDNIPTNVNNVSTAGASTLISTASEVRVNLAHMRNARVGDALAWVLTACEAVGSLQASSCAPLRVLTATLLAKACDFAADTVRCDVDAQVSGMSGTSSGHASHMLSSDLPLLQRLSVCAAARAIALCEQMRGIEEMALPVPVEVIQGLRQLSMHAHTLYMALALKTGVLSVEGFSPSSSVSSMNASDSPNTTSSSAAGSTSTANAANASTSTSNVSANPSVNAPLPSLLPLLATSFASTRAQISALLEIARAVSSTTDTTTRHGMRTRSPYVGTPLARIAATDSMADPHHNAVLPPPALPPAPPGSLALHRSPVAMDAVLPDPAPSAAGTRTSKAAPQPQPTPVAAAVCLGQCLPLSSAYLAADPNAAMEAELSHASGLSLTSTAATTTSSTSSSAPSALPSLSTQSLASTARVEAPEAPLDAVALTGTLRALAADPSLPLTALPPPVAGALGAGARVGATANTDTHILTTATTTTAASTATSTSTFTSTVDASSTAFPALYLPSIASFLSPYNLNTDIDVRARASAADFAQYCVSLAFELAMPHVDVDAAGVSVGGIAARDDHDDYGGGNGVCSMRSDGADVTTSDVNMANVSAFVKNTDAHAKGREEVYTRSDLHKALTAISALHKHTTTHDRQTHITLSPDNADIDPRVWALLTSGATPRDVKKGRQATGATVPAHGHVPVESGSVACELGVGAGITPLLYSLLYSPATDITTTITTSTVSTSTTATTLTRSPSTSSITTSTNTSTTTTTTTTTGASVSFRDRASRGKPDAYPVTLSRLSIAAVAPCPSPAPTLPLSLAHANTHTHTHADEVEKEREGLSRDGRLSGREAKDALAVHLSDIGDITGMRVNGLLQTLAEAAKSLGSHAPIASTLSTPFSYSPLLAHTPLHGHVDALAVLSDTLLVHTEGPTVPLPASTLASVAAATAVVRAHRVYRVAAEHAAMDVQGHNYAVALHRQWLTQCTESKVREPKDSTERGSESTKQEDETKTIEALDTVSALTTPPILCEVPLALHVSLARAALEVGLVAQARTLTALLLARIYRVYARGGVVEIAASEVLASGSSSVNMQRNVSSLPSLSTSTSTSPSLLSLPCASSLRAQAHLHIEPPLSLLAFDRALPHDHLDTLRRHAVGLSTVLDLHAIMHTPAHAPLPASPGAVVDVLAAKDAVMRAAAASLSTSASAGVAAHSGVPIDSGVVDNVYPDWACPLTALFSPVHVYTRRHSLLSLAHTHAQAHTRASACMSIDGYGGPHASASPQPIHMHTNVPDILSRAYNHYTHTLLCHPARSISPAPALTTLASSALPSHNHLATHTSDLRMKTALKTSLPAATPSKVKIQSPNAPLPRYAGTVAPYGDVYAAHDIILPLGVGSVPLLGYALSAGQHAVCAVRYQQYLCEHAHAHHYIVMAAKGQLAVQLRVLATYMQQQYTPPNDTLTLPRTTSTSTFTSSSASASLSRGDMYDDSAAMPIAPTSLSASISTAVSTSITASDAITAQVHQYFASAPTTEEQAVHAAQNQGTTTHILSTSKATGKNSRGSTRERKDDKNRSDGVVVDASSTHLTNTTCLSSGIFPDLSDDLSIFRQSPALFRQHLLTHVLKTATRRAAERLWLVRTLGMSLLTASTSNTNTTSATSVPASVLLSGLGGDVTAMALYLWQHHLAPLSCALRTLPLPTHSATHSAAQSSHVLSQSVLTPPPSNTPVFARAGAAHGSAFVGSGAKSVCPLVLRHVEYTPTANTTTNTNTDTDDDALPATLPLATTPSSPSTSLPTFSSLTADAAIVTAMGTTLPSAVLDVYEGANVDTQATSSGERSVRKEFRTFHPELVLSHLQSQASPALSLFALTNTCLSGLRAVVHIFTTVFQGDVQTLCLAATALAQTAAVMEELKVNVLWHSESHVSSATGSASGKNNGGAGRGSSGVQHSLTRDRPFAYHTSRAKQARIFSPTNANTSNTNITANADASNTGKLTAAVTHSLVSSAPSASGLVDASDYDASNIPTSTSTSTSRPGSFALPLALLRAAAAANVYTTPHDTLAFADDIVYAVARGPAALPALAALFSGTSRTSTPSSTSVLILSPTPITVTSSGIHPVPCLTLASSSSPRLPAPPTSSSASLSLYLDSSMLLALYTDLASLYKRAMRAVTNYITQQLHTHTRTLAYVADMHAHTHHAVHPELSHGLRCLARLANTTETLLPRDSAAAPSLAFIPLSSLQSAHTALTRTHPDTAQHTPLADLATSSVLSLWEQYCEATLRVGHVLAAHRTLSCYIYEAEEHIYKQAFAPSFRFDQVAVPGALPLSDEDTEARLLADCGDNKILRAIALGHIATRRATAAQQLQLLHTALTTLREAEEARVESQVMHAVSTSLPRTVTALPVAISRQASRLMQLHTLVKPFIDDAHAQRGGAVRSVSAIGSGSGIGGGSGSGKGNGRALSSCLSLMLAALFRPWAHAAVSSTVTPAVTHEAAGTQEAATTPTSGVASAGSALHHISIATAVTNAIHNSLPLPPLPPPLALATTPTTITVQAIVPAVLFSSAATAPRPPAYYLTVHAKRAGCTHVTQADNAIVGAGVPLRPVAKTVVYIACTADGRAGNTHTYTRTVSPAHMHASTSTSASVSIATPPLPAARMGGRESKKPQTHTRTQSQPQALARSALAPTSASKSAPASVRGEVVVVPVEVLVFPPVTLMNLHPHHSYSIAYSLSSQEHAAAPTVSSSLSLSSLPIPTTAVTARSLLYTRMLLTTLATRYLAPSVNPCILAPPSQYTPATINAGPHAKASPASCLPSSTSLVLVDKQDVQPPAASAALAQRVSMMVLEAGGFMSIVSACVRGILAMMGMDAGDDRRMCTRRNAAATHTATAPATAGAGAGAVNGGAVAAGGVSDDSHRMDIFADDDGGDALHTLLAALQNCYASPVRPAGYVHQHISATTSSTGKGKGSRDVSASATAVGVPSTRRVGPLTLPVSFSTPALSLLSPSSLLRLFNCIIGLTDLLHTHYASSRVRAHPDFHSLALLLTKGRTHTRPSNVVAVEDQYPASSLLCAPPLAPHVVLSLPTSTVDEAMCVSDLSNAHTTLHPASSLQTLQTLTIPVENLNENTMNTPPASLATSGSTSSAPSSTTSSSSRVSTTDPSLAALTPQQLGVLVHPLFLSLQVAHTLQSPSLLTHTSYRLVSIASALITATGTSLHTRAHASLLGTVVLALVAAFRALTTVKMLLPTTQWSPLLTRTTTRVCVLLLHHLPSTFADIQADILQSHIIATAITNSHAHDVLCSALASLAHITAAESAHHDLYRALALTLQAERASERARLAVNAYHMHTQQLQAVVAYHAATNALPDDPRRRAKGGVEGTTDRVGGVGNAGDKAGVDRGDRTHPGSHSSGSGSHTPKPPSGPVPAVRPLKSRNRTVRGMVEEVESTSIPVPALTAVLPTPPQFPELAPYMPADMPLVFFARECVADMLLLHKCLEQASTLQHAQYLSVAMASSLPLHALTTLSTTHAPSSSISTTLTPSVVDLALLGATHTQLPDTASTCPLCGGCDDVPMTHANASTSHTGVSAPHYSGSAASASAFGVPTHASALLPALPTSSRTRAPCNCLHPQVLLHSTLHSQPLPETAHAKLTYSLSRAHALFSHVLSVVTSPLGGDAIAFLCDVEKSTSTSTAGVGAGAGASLASSALISHIDSILTSVDGTHTTASSPALPPRTTNNNNTNSAASLSSVDAPSPSLLSPSLRALAITFTLYRNHPDLPQMTATITSLALERCEWRAAALALLVARRAHALSSSASPNDTPTATTTIISTAAISTAVTANNACPWSPRPVTPSPLSSSLCTLSLLDTHLALSSSLAALTDVNTTPTTRWSDTLSLPRALPSPAALLNTVEHLPSCSISITAAPVHSPALAPPSASTPPVAILQLQLELLSALLLHTTRARPLVSRTMLLAGTGTGTSTYLYDVFAPFAAPLPADPQPALQQLLRTRASLSDTATNTDTNTDASASGSVSSSHLAPLWVSFFTHCDLPLPSSLALFLAHTPHAHTQHVRTSYTQAPFFPVTLATSAPHPSPASFPGHAMAMQATLAPSSHAEFCNMLRQLVCVASQAALASSVVPSSSLLTAPTLASASTGASSSSSTSLASLQSTIVTTARITLQLLSTLLSLPITPAQLALLDMALSPAFPSPLRHEQQCSHIAGCSDVICVACLRARVMPIVVVDASGNALTRTPNTATTTTSSTSGSATPATAAALAAACVEFHSLFAPTTAPWTTQFTEDNTTTSASTSTNAIANGTSGSVDANTSPDSSTSSSSPTSCVSPSAASAASAASPLQSSTTSPSLLQGLVSTVCVLLRALIAYTHTITHTDTDAVIDTNTNDTSADTTSTSVPSLTATRAWMRAFSLAFPSLDLTDMQRCVLYTIQACHHAQAHTWLLDVAALATQLWGPVILPHIVAYTRCAAHLRLHVAQSLLDATIAAQHSLYHKFAETLYVNHTRYTSRISTALRHIDANIISHLLQTYHAHAAPLLHARYTLQRLSQSLTRAINTTDSLASIASKLTTPTLLTAPSECSLPSRLLAAAHHTHLAALAHATHKPISPSSASTLILVVYKTETHLISRALAHIDTVLSPLRLAAQKGGVAVEVYAVATMLLVEAVLVHWKRCLVVAQALSAGAPSVGASRSNTGVSVDVPTSTSTDAVLHMANKLVATVGSLIHTLLDTILNTSHALSPVMLEHTFTLASAVNTNNLVPPPPHVVAGDAVVAPQLSPCVLLCAAKAVCVLVEAHTHALASATIMASDTNTEDLTANNTASDTTTTSIPTSTTTTTTTRVHSFTEAPVPTRTLLILAAIFAATLGRPIRQAPSLLPLSALPCSSPLSGHWCWSYISPIDALHRLHALAQHAGRQMHDAETALQINDVWEGVFDLHRHMLCPRTRTRMVLEMGMVVVQALMDTRRLSEASQRFLALQLLLSRVAHGIQALDGSDLLSLPSLSISSLSHWLFTHTTLTPGPTPSVNPKANTTNTRATASRPSPTPAASPSPVHTRPLSTSTAALLATLITPIHRQVLLQLCYNENLPITHPSNAPFLALLATGASADAISTHTRAPGSSQTSTSTTASTYANRQGMASPSPSSARKSGQPQRITSARRQAPLSSSTPPLSTTTTASALGVGLVEVDIMMLLQHISSLCTMATCTRTPQSPALTRARTAAGGNRSGEPMSGTCDDSVAVPLSLPLNLPSFPCPAGGTLSIAHANMATVSTSSSTAAPASQPPRVQPRRPTLPSTNTSVPSTIATSTSTPTAAGADASISAAVTTATPTDASTIVCPALVVAVINAMAHNQPLPLHNIYDAYAHLAPQTNGISFIPTSSARSRLPTLAAVVGVAVLYRLAVLQGLLLLAVVQATDEAPVAQENAAGNSHGHACDNGGGVMPPMGLMVIPDVGTVLATTTNAIVDPIDATTTEPATDTATAANGSHGVVGINGGGNVDTCSIITWWPEPPHSECRPCHHATHAHTTSDASQSTPTDTDSSAALCIYDSSCPCRLLTPSRGDAVREKDRAVGGDKEKEKDKDRERADREKDSAKASATPTSALFSPIEHTTCRACSLSSFLLHSALKLTTAVDRWMVLTRETAVQMSLAHFYSLGTAIADAAHPIALHTTFAATTSISASITSPRKQPNTNTIASTSASTSTSSTTSTSAAATPSLMSESIARVQHQLRDDTLYLQYANACLNNITPWGVNTHVSTNPTSTTNTRRRVARESSEDRASQQGLQTQLIFTEQHSPATEAWLLSLGYALTHTHVHANMFTTSANDSDIFSSEYLQTSHSALPSPLLLSPTLRAAATTASALAYLAPGTTDASLSSSASTILSAYGMHASDAYHPSQTFAHTLILNPSRVAAGVACPLPPSLLSTLCLHPLVLAHATQRPAPAVTLPNAPLPSWAEALKATLASSSVNSPPYGCRSPLLSPAEPLAAAFLALTSPVSTNPSTPTAAPIHVSPAQQALVLLITHADMSSNTSQTPSAALDTGAVTSLPLPTCSDDALVETEVMQVTVQALLGLARFHDAQLYITACLSRASATANAPVISTTTTTADGTAQLPLLTPTSPSNPLPLALAASLARLLGPAAVARGLASPQARAALAFLCGLRSRHTLAAALAAHAEMDNASGSSGMGGGGSVMGGGNDAKKMKLPRIASRLLDPILPLTHTDTRALTQAVLAAHASASPDSTHSLATHSGARHISLTLPQPQVDRMTAASLLAFTWMHQGQWQHARRCVSALKASLAGSTHTPAPIPSSADASATSTITSYTSRCIPAPLLSLINLSDAIEAAADTANSNVSDTAGVHDEISSHDAASTISIPTTASVTGTIALIPACASSPAGTPASELTRMLEKTRRMLPHAIAEIRTLTHALAFSPPDTAPHATTTPTLPHHQPQDVTVQTYKQPLALASLLSQLQTLADAVDASLVDTPSSSSHDNVRNGMASTAAVAVSVLDGMVTIIDMLFAAFPRTHTHMPCSCLVHSPLCIRCIPTYLTSLRTQRTSVLAALLLARAHTQHLAAFRSETYPELCAAVMRSQQPLLHAHTLALSLPLHVDVMTALTREQIRTSTASTSTSASASISILPLDASHSNNTSTSVPDPRVSTAAALAYALMSPLASIPLTVSEPTTPNTSAVDVVVPPISRKRPEKEKHKSSEARAVTRTKNKPTSSSSDKTQSKQKGKSTPTASIPEALLHVLAGPDSAAASIIAAIMHPQLLPTSSAFAMARAEVSRAVCHVLDVVVGSLMRSETTSSTSSSSSSLLSTAAAASSYMPAVGALASAPIPVASVFAPVTQRITDTWARHTPYANLSIHALVDPLTTRTSPVHIAREKVLRRATAHAHTLTNLMERAYAQHNALYTATCLMQSPIHCLEKAILASAHVIVRYITNTQSQASGSANSNPTTGTSHTGNAGATSTPSASASTNTNTNTTSMAALTAADPSHVALSSLAAFFHRNLALALLPHAMQLLPRPHASSSSSSQASPPSGGTHTSVMSLDLLLHTLFSCPASQHTVLVHTDVDAQGMTTFSLLLSPPSTTATVTPTLTTTTVQTTDAGEVCTAPTTVISAVTPNAAVTSAITSPSNDGVSLPSLCVVQPRTLPTCSVLRLPTVEVARVRALLLEIRTHVSAHICDYTRNALNTSTAPNTISATTTTGANIDPHDPAYIPSPPHLLDAWSTALRTITTLLGGPDATPADDMLSCVSLTTIQALERVLSGDTSCVFMQAVDVWRILSDAVCSVPTNI